MRLMCGHACLGMCCETCPSLCGTCNRQSYVSLIKEYLGAYEALSKLPRIIVINGCKHIFPVEEIAFGRNCSQPCVLCPRLCDNSCQHRSCGKRCYEVCDVKPCEQPCTMRLMCGHACLGMCSETCPSLCGTCNRQSYVSLIKEYLGACKTLSKLPRIIVINGCKHIFPVEFLDKHVSSSQEQSSTLLCPFPGCEVPLSGIQRYSRQIKKQILEKYQQRFVSALTMSENSRRKVMNTCRNIIQKELKDCKEVHRLSSQRRMPKREHELVDTIVDLVTNAEKILVDEQLKGSDLYCFWKEYTKCIVILSQLAHAFVIGVRFTKNSPPLIRELLFDIVGRGGVHKAFVSFRQLI
ncbi:unnamed protein product [Strongylus vulgaris]|uniref:Uncharacterized protein n=1 Tax=Strongylus vulgaris TaxID=40348 RepID=A0A3P7JM18_STRVU|nr:unnamed protein product [Strongylus vulgaris]